MQKLVRRRQAPQVGRVAVQYLRQIGDHRAKGVNEDRIKMLTRLTVVAAEDADAVPSLAIAHFHRLAATSGDAIKWGENDAAAVAACWASVASTATYCRGEYAACRGTIGAAEPADDLALEYHFNIGDSSPNAELFCVRAVAKAAKKSHRGKGVCYEAKWLLQLHKKMRTNQGPEAPAPALEAAQVADTEAVEQQVACEFSAGDARILLRDVKLAPLLGEHKPFCAVDHHAKSTDTIDRSTKLIGMLLEHVDDMTVKRSAVETELKHEAYYNIRSPVQLRVVKTGTWQAIVEDKWPECAAAIWRDSTASSPVLAVKKRSGSGSGRGWGSGGGGGQRGL
jgi:hypothetical protein